MSEWRIRYKLDIWEIEAEGDEKFVREIYEEIKRKELPPFK